MYKNALIFLFFSSFRLTEGYGEADIDCDNWQSFSTTNQMTVSGTITQQMILRRLDYYVISSTHGNIMYIHMCIKTVEVAFVRPNITRVTITKDFIDKN